MDPDAIRAAVHDLFKKGDETIIDYVCGILEDEHFEFGDDGEGAFDSIGPFLVRAMWAAWPPRCARTFLWLLHGDCFHLHAQTSLSN